MTQRGQPDLMSMLVPVAGSLVLSGAAMAGLCFLPTRDSLAWPGLLRFAVFLLVVVAAVHGFSVWWITRVMEDGRGPALAKALWSGAWMPVALLPALLLLARVGSPFSAVVLPVVAGVTALRLRGWSGGADGRGWRVSGQSAPTAMFAPLPGAFSGGWVLPALVIAVAGLGAVAALAAGSPLTAGALLALATVLVVEGASVRRARLRAWDSRRPGRLLRETATALLLAVLALTPFLRQGGVAAMAAAWLGVAPQPKLPEPPKEMAKSGGRGGSLSGVILVLPPKPKRKDVPQPPVPGPPQTSATPKPLVVPFDGQYWYFHRPDERPRADAKTVRGDPLKVTVHSTDARPLEMEAHQRLDPPLSTVCCRAMRLVVRRAADQSGAVGLQVLLRGRSGDTTWSYSLGVQPLPDGDGKGEVVLRYVMPQALRERTFDEIAVVVRPERGVSRVGAHVSVERFELEP